MIRNLFARGLRVFKRIRILRTMPLRLEFVVTDYCNLNCRGCTHYSPLAPKEFVPVNELREWMNHLGRACGRKVSKVYLIGGETLLYPDLIKAMRDMRESFPTQEISIFTNGLAVSRMSEEFWTAAREVGAVMALTRYPIRFDYDAVEELIRSKGVGLKVFADRSLKESFFRFALDPKKKQNKYISHFKCYNRGCVSIVDGYVYPCSIAGCVKHLNRAKGTDFEVTDRDRIPVEKVKSARQIYRLSHRPIPFCSYCILPPASVGYAPSRRETSEWVD